MNTQVANIKTARYCAFCKYWWDPSCADSGLWLNLKAKAEEEMTKRK